VRAAPRGGHLRLLATGDSMIQIIDGFLRQRLGRRGVRVRSDAHVSSGISKPSLLNWPRQAKRQAARAPDVVVMFLGANDGFSMGSAACCGEAWAAEYARRARNMMRTHGRGGRTRIYWLTLADAGQGSVQADLPRRQCSDPARGHAETLRSSTSWTCSRLRGAAATPCASATASCASARAIACT
jgi:hypothetical protein